MIGPMKLALVWFSRFVPASLLIGIGLAQIVAGYVPALKDRSGQAPVPLTVGMIVVGSLSMALSVWVVSVEQRYKRFVASRQAAKSANG